MRALVLLGLLCFFIQHYLFYLLITIANLIKLAWKVIAGADHAKQHILPHQAAHPHVFANLYDFVSCDGYALEVFKFQTPDNASVEMWRIFKKDCKFNKPYPILLMHGLLDCSASWFVQVDKSKCLPYMLASQGYEVWVGNNRGTRVSQPEQHIDEKYWDYALDHMVEYDQPTIIQGVLKASGKAKIIYIGHSQGSTQFILGMGAHRHLHDKIAGFAGLGTAVSLKNLDNHFILKLVDKFQIVELCNFLGLKRILRLPHCLSKCFGSIVNSSWVHYNMVMLFIRLLCGFSKKNKFSEDYMGVMLTHEPGGCSTNNIFQWVDCFRNGSMRKFNYGRKRNMEIYGKHEPDAYCLKHLEDLPFNTYLFRGSKDAVIPQNNFIQLVSMFNPEKVTAYQLPDYNHLEYLWSQTAHQDVYPHLVKMVEECSH